MTTDNFESRLNAVDRAILTPVVRRCLNDDTLTISDWAWQPLQGGSAKAIGMGGLYRFFGEAQCRGESTRWAVILKTYHLIEAHEGSPASGNERPTSWNYWKREALAYSSGLLRDLSGGLVAPQCYGVYEYANAEVWVWLEEIHEAAGRRWSLEQFGVAAYHLGQFNGATLVRHPLPDQPWLTKGRVREYLRMTKPMLDILPDATAHPLAGRWLTRERAEGILRLVDDSPRYLASFDRLPRCLCHHDAYRRNLLMRHNQQGRAQTVAIDWAIFGTGAVGEEIATLLTASLRWLDANVADAHELDRIVFQNYLAGLRDVGWQGDEMLVRFGLITAASYFGGVGGLIFLPGVLDAQLHPILEQLIGDSLDRILAQWALLQDYLFELGDEMRQSLIRIDSIL